VSPGLIVLLVALAVAVLGGVAWQQRSGRMRAPRAAAAPGPAEGMIPGTAAGPMSAELAGQKLRLTGEQIGSALGARATLVQFSSAFCAPCRATRRILADVAGMTNGVEYVEIDAESRLDLVRRLNVLRTPTVFVLDTDGGIVRRASGQPRKADVIAAIGDAVRL
jgi:thiol-disulfide isomerase/thioredoxin